MTMIEFVIASKVKPVVLYEQMAEECIELAHACQKKARILRGENPTPVTSEEADDMVLEEFTDVTLVAGLLQLKPSNIQLRDKLLRWRDRLEDDNRDFK